MKAFHSAHKIDVTVTCLHIFRIFKAKYSITDGKVHNKLQGYLKNNKLIQFQLDRVNIDYKKGYNIH
jgi:hypothetical protein